MLSFFGAHSEAFEIYLMSFPIQCVAYIRAQRILVLMLMELISNNFNLFRDVKCATEWFPSNPPPPQLHETMVPWSRTNGLKWCNFLSFAENAPAHKITLDELYSGLQSSVLFAVVAVVYMLSIPLFEFIRICIIRNSIYTLKWHIIWFECVSFFTCEPKTKASNHISVQI